MFLPEGLTQVRKLLKEHPRTDALQPLDDCADVLIRAIRHKHVDVIACHFSRQNRQLVLHRDLSDQIAHTNGHLPSQHALPILRDPDQVDFEIGFRVRSVSIPPHATTPTTLFSSPEGEGFRLSPEGTLKLTPGFLVFRGRDGEWALTCLVTGDTTAAEPLTARSDYLGV